MKRFVCLVLSVAMACQLVAAAGKDEFPVIRKKIDPNEGRPTTGVVFEAANVALTVDQNGVPFSLESSVPLPDYVVQALEQWRYSPFKKNGRAFPFQAKLVVPVARKLTPLVERNLAPIWYPSHEVVEALKKGYGLTDAQAQDLEAELPDKSQPDGPRTVLLAYYATKGAQNAEKALTERAKLLTWLVEHNPQNSVLGSPLAVVNSAGGALADADTNEKLSKLWTDAMTLNPDDEAIRVHALNFLQVSHPTAALKVLAGLPRWGGTASWAGQIYALSAVGVTALNPDTGKPIAASNTGDTSALAALLKATDTRMVLAGLSTVIWAGRSLGAEHQLPAGFKPHCEELLQHAKQLYPQTTQSCDIDSDVAADRTPNGANVVPAELVNKIQPRYPWEAKQDRVTGTVTFRALVDSSGDIEELGLMSGPLPLYGAAYDAVKRWRYRPTTVNGKAVSFVTSMVINFSLNW